jgi:hypothetical protein
MFRVSFHLTDGARQARDWGRELRRAVPAGVLIVADFLDAKTVEAFVEIDEDSDIRAVTDLIAQRLGLDEYEVTPVQRLGSPATEVPPVPEHARGSPMPSVADDPRLLHVHPGAITRVLVHQPDERALSVQVRHRRHETIEAIAVRETAEVVEIQVTVGTPEPDPHVSLGVSFSWVDTGLRRPLGGRRIVRRVSSAARDTP